MSNLKNNMFLNKIWESWYYANTNILFQFPFYRSFFGMNSYKVFHVFRFSFTCIQSHRIIKNHFTFILKSKSSDFGLIQKTFPDIDKIFQFWIIIHFYFIGHITGLSEDSYNIFRATCYLTNCLHIKLLKGNCVIGKFNLLFDSWFHRSIIR